MAKEEEKADKTTDKPDRGYVQYVGASGRRGITLADMESVGVTGQKSDLWWTRENGWKVPRADISDEVYERALKPDPEMILVNGEGDEAVKEEHLNRAPLAAEMTPMPPGPESPDDYVGGGTLTGGTAGGGTTGATAGTTGAPGTRGTRGATGGRNR